MIFRYFRANITSNRKLEKEVQAQTIKVDIMSGYLRDIIWRDKYTSFKSKIRIYKICMRPVMTYANETRAGITKSITKPTIKPLPIKKNGNEDFEVRHWQHFAE